MPALRRNVRGKLQQDHSLVPDFQEPMQYAHVKYRITICEIQVGTSVPG
jgi:hypothetical protein